MPVDAEPRDDGNIILATERTPPGALHAKPDEAPGRPRYVSHFATCPFAKQHRKARS